MTSSVYDTAIRQVQYLLVQAQRRGVLEPTAAALATTDEHHRPSVRMVLLKEVNDHGVVFFTNCRSRKAQHLAAQPYASLCCFWGRLGRQVIIEGCVAPVDEQEADAYWATRPRITQLGAWASLQSQRLPRTAVLKRRLADYRGRFAHQPVPRPLHWSGYRVIPDRIEFWRARPYRLNERIVYTRTRGRWTTHRLYP